MGRYTGPVCRLCRREGRKLYLKGQRCLSPKCAMEKRAYPPGQFGQHRGRRRRRSDYAVQLRAKQTLRTFYGLLEHQFKRYVDQAERMPGVTGDNLLALLETRLDSVVYRSGLVASRAQARQLVGQRHFLVNGHVVDIPSYRVRPGDEIAVREKSRNIQPIVEAIEIGARVPPRWLEVDYENRKIKVVDMPTRQDIDVPGDEQLVIEFYSR
ncbi:MAG: 30S ribosomal protein S4 [Armatimonadetes bacterium]|nr:30S ribosomal protein S4 [Armatimonadota bacterium]